MELVDNKYLINYMNSVKQDLLFGVKIDWEDTAKTLAVMRNEEEYDIDKTKFIIAYSIKLDAYGKESQNLDENTKYKAELRCAEKYGLKPEEVSKRLDVANKVMRLEEQRGYGFGDREYYDTFKETCIKLGVKDAGLDMIMFDQEPQITGTNKDLEYTGERKVLEPILDVPTPQITGTNKDLDYVEPRKLEPILDVPTPQISGTNKDLDYEEPRRLEPILDVDESLFYGDNEEIDDNDIANWSPEEIAEFISNVGEEEKENKSNELDGDCLE
ncbi:MAG: hypothetical protein MJ244_00640 [Clostridia bacterium]|nr:hypothetical protein [Clostridia bacterium]